MGNQKKWASDLPRTFAKPKRGAVVHLVKLKDEGRVLHRLCWADDLYVTAGTMDHLTRILEDLTNSIERLGMQWKEKRLTIVAGPFTEYKPGDVVEIISNNGGRWVSRVVEGMEALGTWLDSRCCSEASLWHRISKANSMFYAKKALFCDPNCRSRGVFMPSTRRVLLRCFMVLVIGFTRSQCFRHCVSGNLVNFVECCACAGDLMSAGRIHMKRTGPIVARRWKKHGQPRLQTLAIRSVRIAAWQMVRCPNNAKGLRYWEESATWRSDEERREATSNCPRRIFGTARSGLPGYYGCASKLDLLKRVLMVDVC